MNPYQPSREDFDQYMIPIYSPAPMIPVRGQGSRLWDQGGREYIDFVGGIAVNALGHLHPIVVNALIEQGQKLWHVANGFTNEPALRLAKKLIDSTFAEKVFFCNSGAEANEAALKLARKVGLKSGIANKNKIIAFNNAFHGRTLFTVSTGGQAKYSQDFAPLPEGIEHLPFNDLAAVKAAISDQTCAVIIEPIQGEGGVIPADIEFLKGVRQLCDQYKALLIFDEIQTGMGRTGSLYAYMNTPVVPDILTIAKALGGGFPIGAMLTTDQFGKQFVFGDHGTTYGGNPLACAVAGAVFDVINTQDVLDGVLFRSKLFVESIQKLNAQYQVFQEIRGKGLLIGCVLNAHYANRAKEIITFAAEEGVMALIAGPNIVRFTPSLIIPENDIQEGFIRLGRALARFTQEK